MRCKYARVDFCILTNIDLTFFRLLYTATETNEATGALGATSNGTLTTQNRLAVNDDAQSFTGRFGLTAFGIN